MKSKINIIFFGTPQFAVPTLKALYHEGYNIVCVVTQPDKPVGRKRVITPSIVKTEAEKLGLEVCQNINELKSKIKDLRPTVGIVVAYGKIIPQEILDLFPQGCLNIHPSLLPKYRGPSPIQTAILNGDKEIGVSIIKLDEKMDHGEHVACIIYHVVDNDTYESLLEKFADVGAELLVKSLPGYMSGKIKTKAQNDDLATFTKILSREDGKIDWNKSAVEIERMVRAYYPWPGCFMKIEDQRFKTSNIKILSVKINTNLKNGDIGQFENINGQLQVKCGQDSLIINKLQPVGKNEMSGKEFINGYMSS